MICNIMVVHIGSNKFFAKNTYPFLATSAAEAEMQQLNYVGIQFLIT